MQCKICKSNKTKVIREKLRHDIKRRVFLCSGCGYGFLDPSKSVDSRFYSNKNYRQAYGPAVNKVSSCQEIFDTYFPFQKSIVSEIKHILRSKMKVMDVGCSTGHFLQSLKDLVGERVGLELQKEAGEFVQKKFKIPVYSEPIETAKIKEGPFDLITTLQVLEHIDDPAGFLEGIGRNLKPGGYLYIEVPNIDDALLSCYNIKGFANFYFREPHVSYFSVKSLKRLLKDAGFRGTFKTVQRYNIMNHLHWLFTNQPQGNFALGNSKPVLVNSKSAPKFAAQALNKFMVSVDTEYKKILAKYNVAENIAFLGKKAR